MAAYHLSLQEEALVVRIYLYLI